MTTITEIAKKLNLSEKNLIYYGQDKAKIDLEQLNLEKKNLGKLILTTAITPTKAGEGKTTTAIGLADGLAYLKKNVIACLREPSLGPVFGVKGGGTGGGRATLEPSEDINLHFTGDFHAITSVNNLIAAMIDNELFQENLLNIDKNKIVFPRCLDMNDRSLRNIVTCTGLKDGISHKSSFVITAASELMAIFCLATSIEDFLERVSNIIVAYNLDDEPIYVRELDCYYAIKKLIKVALLPNLVQTQYETPAIVHGGPFANIAHGTNSIIATELSLKLADYVVTEAGFGADLGMEKFLDIITPKLNITPSLIVLVCTIRALKLHGGVEFSKLNMENLSALKSGFENLKHHLDVIKKYGLPVLVSINKFAKDTDAEISCLKEYLDLLNVPYALNQSYLDGDVGGVELAEKAIEVINTAENNFKPLITKDMSIQTKIETICKEVYGAKKVVYSRIAAYQMKKYESAHYTDFDICMSKTPNSLTDDPKILNCPKDFTIHIQSVRLFTGAKFLVPLTGSIVTMPGLPLVPAAKLMKD